MQSAQSQPTCRVFRRSGILQRTTAICRVLKASQRAEHSRVQVYFSGPPLLAECPRPANVPSGQGFRPTSADHRYLQSAQVQQTCRAATCPGILQRTNRYLQSVFVHRELMMSKRFAVLLLKTPPGAPGRARGPALGPKQEGRHGRSWARGEASPTFKW